jgi:hypothetical protein
MLSERLFEDILVKYPELIEDRLKFIGRQVTHFGKRIDILFEDRFKEKLIIELKKNNLDRNALSQVMEYEGYILSEKDPSARVMIIANRIPLNLKKAMDHHGIEYKEITHNQLFEYLEKYDVQLLEKLNSDCQIQIETTVPPKSVIMETLVHKVTMASKLDEIIQAGGSWETLCAKAEIESKKLDGHIKYSKGVIMAHIKYRSETQNNPDYIKNLKITQEGIGTSADKIRKPEKTAETIFTEISGQELAASVTFFRERIKTELALTGKRMLAFPGGEKSEGDNYEIQTKYGLLSITVIADSVQLNRYMHFITLNQENFQSSSDTEINFPKVHDSRVNALLAEKQGCRYICNRGKCTVYMRALKISIVLDHFRTEYGNVVELQENGKLISVIQIADLESSLLFEQISQFTHQIKSFKQQFRNL